MRQDSVQFARASRASSKRPRYVVKIEFDVGSIYCTSHNDILSVPGVVLDGVLQEPSAVSQRLIPDEGRSEIGAFSCQLVDLGGQFTDEIRAKLLEDGVGIRKKKVVFYEGYEGFDFSAFQVVTTQIVQYTSYENGVYTVQCADITREQRQSIFEPKFTTLRDNVTDSATTIPVYNTTGFEPVAHGTSWSDAPSSTVGYIKIENEIIRYTGKTADSFTGCTRGALNTKAVAHSVDANASAERRTKVEEYIYIELPAVKLAWAVLTGQLYGSSNTLPDHWHLGVDSSLIRESDFTGIGTDLWDPNDDTAALILRFEGLKKTDGKRFLEKEIYLLLGCYSPVYSDGALGLKRLPALLGDSAPVVTLTEDNITSLGELRHDEDGMHNVFRINWNHDPAKDEFTRITYFTDAESVAIHGAADVKEYSFKGLHGSRHTDAIVRQRLNALRDAYAHPPERITVSVLGSLSYLEMGDVVRLKVANVRDYAGQSSSIDRAFVILQKRHNAARNEVSLDLFGSTARPLATPPGDPDFESASLPDAFYTSAGSNLNTVATITSNVMATGNYTITGHASLKNAAAIYYHDGDLTIPAGCNLTITGNVQLRIKGFLTLNGTINGTGGGNAGVSDPGVQITSPIQGNPGYVGHSRGWDGLDWESTARGVFAGLFVRATSIPAALTRGQHDAFPLLSLSVSGSSLLGLPDDLRGTGGGPGGQIIDDAGNVQSAGGTGAAGGAGLCIICRGMAIGTVGNITLNGANPAPTSVVGAGVFSLYPGVGGAGGPGALLILLDGNTLSIPDITGKFVATTGTVTQLGSPIPSRTFQLDVHNPVVSGFADPAVISAQDWSNAAHRIQYIPETQGATPDVDLRPPAPTAMQLTSTGEAITARITAQFVDPRDVLELWASIDNNRSNAVRVGFGRVTEFTVELPVLTGRYFWTRMRRDYADRPDVFSDWLPPSATGGTFASTLNPSGWTPVVTNGGGATMIVTASTIEKSGGTAAFDSSVRSMEGFHNGSFVSFRSAQTNRAIVVGLSADPQTDVTEASIDFGWLMTTSGQLLIMENGSQLDPGSLTYDTSTVLMIRHDGSTVRYYRNGALVRSTPATDQTLYFDSSFFTPGAKLVDVKFGPQGSKGDKGADGANGLSIAELQIYRRAATAPSTPTGGSYNFSTLTLTPPSGWTSSIPSGNDPVYASRAVAAIQGTSGTDSSLTWSAPVLVTQEGSAVDIIFRRSASQPATPAPSTGVPSGWYSDVASVPASGDPMWSSVGTRANAGQNWTWETPVRVEGQDGAQGPQGPQGPQGSPGANALSISAVPDTRAIKCNSVGTPDSGQFPYTVTATVFSGTSNVSGAAGWGHTQVNCAVSNLGGGVFQVNSMAADSAYFDITASYGGASVTKRCTLSKVLSGANASSVSDTTLTLNVNSTYVGTQGGPLILGVGPGIIRAGVSQGYQVSGGGSRTIAGKIQYRTTPGSGGWIDFGPEVTGFTSISGEPGEIDIVQQMTGPASPANWEFQYVNRSASGSASTVSTGGEFAVWMDND